MSTREIREVFEFLNENQKDLTPYQIDFIRSLKKYYRWKGSLTSRQVECLVSLKDYLSGSRPVKTMVHEVQSV